MTTADITRFLFQPKKHYGGVRLQQGRALLDSDFNEEFLADADDQRRTVIDVVGGRGSPDFGFLPDLRPGAVIIPKLVRFGSVLQSFVLDYNLKPGTMYVGGMRFELEQAESVVFQREFLQMGPTQAPRAASGIHSELAFLRAWEQTVTAVEDSELLEPAMGGADSTARVRRTRRVEVATVQSTECSAAFDEVLETLTTGDVASWDSVTGELKSNGRLRVRFLREASDDDCAACNPMLSSQYLGSENQSIRIMLATPNEYVWGFDNAAQLFRVKLFITGPGQARVRMLTTPKDDFQAPSENTVVEFLPWGALLQNGDPPTGKIPSERVKNEKIASRVGFFGEAVTAYDANSKEFQVRFSGSVTGRIGLFTGKEKFTVKKAKTKKLLGQQIPIDTIAVRWDPQHPNAKELNPNDDQSEGFVAYVFMRVWHKKRPEEPLFVPAASGAPLGTTGLVPEFLHTGKPGDYWTLAVRPNARDRIVPNELQRAEGAPPHGPREFVMPLYLIQWESIAGIINRVVALHDCRPRFRALTEPTCCTVVVSEGADGHADSLQAAVDMLPEEGGRICVRAGTFTGPVSIKGRRDIIIEGCGEHSVVESASGASGGALIDIVGVAGTPANITLEKLTIRAHGQIGVRVAAERVTLRKLAITTGPTGTSSQTRSAISVERGTDVRIIDNRITMDGSFSPHAAVYVETDFTVGGAIISGNRIETLSNAPSPPGTMQAWGGLHIANGSRNVEVLRNHVISGVGHGITLGSVVFIAPSGLRRVRLGAGFGQMGTSAPFSVTGSIGSFTETIGTQTVRFYPDPGRGDGNDTVDMSDIVIADNRIQQMMGSGISSLAVIVDNPQSVFDAAPFIRGVFCVHRNTTIRDNLIVANTMTSFSIDLPFVLGGIVVSEGINLDVRGNEILDNVTQEDIGVCGVYVGAGQNLVIESNRIQLNGPSAGEVSTGNLHGGIVIVWPFLLAVELQIGTTTIHNLRRKVFPRKVFIRKNIADQPTGAGLVALTTGPLAVTGNYFSSGNPLGGAFPGFTAFAIDLGTPWEAIDLPPNEPNPGRWSPLPVGSQDYLQGIVSSPFRGDGGALLFSDNQVTSVQANPPESQVALTPRVIVISADHVCAKGNQIAGALDGVSMTTHAVFAAATCTIRLNRVAEGVNDAKYSFVAPTFLLESTTGNITSHCYATQLGSQNPAFLKDVNNLILLQATAGCASLADLGSFNAQAFISLFSAL